MPSPLAVPEVTCSQPRGPKLEEVKLHEALSSYVAAPVRDACILEAGIAVGEEQTPAPAKCSASA